MPESTATTIEPARPTAERKTLLPSTDELNRMMYLAKGFAAAGAARNEGEALAKIQLGWEAGIGPGAAMTEISLIDGPSGRKPSLSPLMMRGLVQMRGLGTIDPICVDDQICICRVTRADWNGRTEEVAFGIEEALKAGLMILNGQKKPVAHGKHPNYDRYRPDMFLARSSARAWRRFFPELAAGLPYCPEELADEISGGAPAVLVPFPENPYAAAVPQPMPQIVTSPEPTTVAAVDAPMPLPTPIAPTGGEQAEASPPVSVPADPFAAGLADVDRVTLLGEHMNRALSLKGLLRMDLPQYKAWLRLHFQAESIRTMTPDDAQRVVVALDRLHKLERLRAECKISDAQWSVALAKRGVASMYQMTAQQVQEMVNKLADSIDPFRRKSLGLDCGVSGPIANSPAVPAAGGHGGNGSTPTAGGSPPPAQPSPVRGAGPAPSVPPPSLIPQALAMQAA